jgi:hypothetical protein
MLAFAPPEIAAAGIPVLPRGAECTISHEFDDTEVFPRTEGDGGVIARVRPQVNSGRGRPEWDLSYGNLWHGTPKWDLS